MIIKLLKDKEDPESSERKVTPHIQRIINNFQFLIKSLGDQKAMGWYIQSAQRKNCEVRIIYPAKLSFKNEEEKQKLREFIATRSGLGEMLKVVFQVKMKEN